MQMKIGHINNEQIIWKLAQLKCLDILVAIQNLIQVEIKRWLNSSNACYHLVENISSIRWKCLSDNIQAADF
jgi:hypothetical protein